ncbi:MAG TPA: hypothetical protein PL048_21315 [Leptospiraceae bacterium]|nr:hypothetical protein [Leptospiraceae bacterium]HNN02317.1 hypothetical protein [Leptospiraceae bacterium]
MAFLDVLSSEEIETSPTIKFTTAPGIAFTGPEFFLHPGIAAKNTIIKTKKVFLCIYSPHWNSFNSSAEIIFLT